MIQKALERPSNHNILYLIMCNAFFLIYYYVFNASLLALLFTLLIFLVLFKIGFTEILKFVNKKDLTNYLPEQGLVNSKIAGHEDSIVEVVYNELNNWGNKFSKLFLSSDFISIIFTTFILYLIQSVCFYLDDSLIVLLLSNLYILSRIFESYIEEYKDKIQQLKQTIRQNMKWIPSKESPVLESQEAKQ